ncbi:hypothetical protein JRO89_XS01G0338200 [Xanthoceras sorbifolium]|uniref:DNA-directed RNA polymerase subunit n=1 Tax=Xanthoceras sorbifolium TaxID=99658 RepID=A0ABQ8IP39_9ROSI|nr:hypothetical protein JRO89_XS01G0338200 [Xanthoceras sorbifolium]
MEFCPTCGTMLQYELPHMDHPARFACPSCPYVCNMESKVFFFFFFSFLLDPQISCDELCEIVESIMMMMVCNIVKVKLKRKQPLGKKEIQPIFTQDSMFEGPQTEVTCPSCKFGKAVYHELQTRSADEPMTIFYMCANKNCKHRWNE